MIDYCLVPITYALKLLVIKDIFNQLGLQRSTFEVAAFHFLENPLGLLVGYAYVRMDPRVSITKQKCHI